MWFGTGDLWIYFDWPVNAGRFNLEFMNCDVYAPWEHYPKTLRQEEVMNPIMVIAEFFSSDSVQGHQKQLKTWRHYVISDESYPGGRHGPGDLLFDYDLNLKLLEAVYLLYGQYQTYKFRVEVTSAEQLAAERATWDYFPGHLFGDEIRNPYVGVKEVFDKISPQGYRDYLHEWLHSALHYKADVEGLTAGNVILVYENLVRLYSLAWLIYQRHGKGDFRRRQIAEDIFDLSNLTIGEIRGIDPQATPAEKLGLGEIRKLIVEHFPTVEMIVHLGTHQKPFIYFLLLLIADDEVMSEHEISNKMEDNLKFLANVYVIAHTTGSARAALASGRRFWSRAMSRGDVVFRKPNLELPEVLPISETDLVERARFHWERWGRQGKGFLHGAEVYRSEENYRLAVFLLHQAVEGILKGMIQCVLGYRVQMHNLSRLLRLTPLFTNDLISVFDFGSSEDVQLFSLLQKAYSQSRYNNSFEPDKESVELLCDKIKKLAATADKIYESYMHSLS